MIYYCTKTMGLVYKGIDSKRKIFRDKGSEVLVLYLLVMGQQLRKRLKRERRMRYNKRVKARANQAKKA